MNLQKIGNKRYSAHENDYNAEVGYDDGTEVYADGNSYPGWYGWVAMYHTYFAGGDALVRFNTMQEVVNKLEKIIKEHNEN